MRWNAYSGDCCMDFYGHAYATATYVLKHPAFGWLSFGGNMNVAHDGAVHVTPKDSARTRLFLAPSRAWITLEAGKIAGASDDPKSGAITLTLDAATSTTPGARLFVDSGGRKLRLQRVSESAADNPVGERGGYTVPLTGMPSQLLLTPL
jgi:hypothetical protein